MPMVVRGAWKTAVMTDNSMERVLFLEQAAVEQGLSDVTHLTQYPFLLSVCSRRHALSSLSFYLRLFALAAAGAAAHRSGRCCRRRWRRRWLWRRQRRRLCVSASSLALQCQAHSCHIAGSLWGCNHAAFAQLDSGGSCGKSCVSNGHRFA
jgi:hypothetical protein